MFDYTPLGGTIEKTQTIDYQIINIVFNSSSDA